MLNGKNCLDGQRSFSLQLVKTEYCRQNIKFIHGNSKGALAKVRKIGMKQTQEEDDSVV